MKAFPLALYPGNLIATKFGQCDDVRLLNTTPLFDYHVIKALTHHKAEGETRGPRWGAGGTPVHGQYR